MAHILKNKVPGLEKLKNTSITLSRSFPAEISDVYEENVGQVTLVSFEAQSLFWPFHLSINMSNLTLKAVSNKYIIYIPNIIVSKATAMYFLLSYKIGIWFIQIWLHAM